MLWSYKRDVRDLDNPNLNPENYVWLIIEKGSFLYGLIKHTIPIRFVKGVVYNL